MKIVGQNNPQLSNDKKVYKKKKGNGIPRKKKKYKKVYKKKKETESHERKKI
jgi:hypothetical protein